MSGCRILDNGRTKEGSQACNQVADAFFLKQLVQYKKTFKVTSMRIINPTAWKKLLSDLLDPVRHHTRHKEKVTNG